MLRLVDKIQDHEGICWNVSWDASGEVLASCGQDRSIKLWKVIDGKLVRVSSTSEEDRVHSRTIRRVAWRRDSKCIAATSFDSTCSLWRVNSDYSLTYLTKISGQESEVKGVSFSPCGELLATCSRDKSIWVFDVSSVLMNGDSSESSIEFSKVVSGESLEVFDEAEFAFPTSPSEVVRNPKPGEVDCVAVLQGHSQDVKNVKFDPRNSSFLVSVSYDDSVKIWSDVAGEWELLHTLRSHTNTVWDVAFDPSKSSSRFATVSADGSLKVWAASRFSDTQQNSYGPLGIAHRTLNAPTVVSANWSCLTRQVTTSNVANVPPAPIYAVDWSDNGLIALACGDNALRVFQAGKSIIPLSTVKTHSEPTCVCFASGGRLAVSFDDGSIALVLMTVESVKLENMTSQKFGRQSPRGPVKGFMNMLKIFITDIHYPRAVLVNVGLLVLCTAPLVMRESFYQADAKKGSPWDRVIAEREKNE